MPPKKNKRESENLELIKQELDEIKELHEDEGKLKKALKRAFVFVAALLLLFLFLTYLVPSYNLFSIIPAQFDSYKIENNTIDLKNKKIIFENSSYDDLLEVYYGNQQHEFKACLIGKKENNSYIVEKIEIPEIISQDFSSVTAKPCSKEAIISLHSHPYKSCYFSVHDVSTYRIVKDINQDAIMAVMCESDRFNFYGFK